MTVKVSLAKRLEDEDILEWGANNKRDGSKSVVMRVKSLLFLSGVRGLNIAYRENHLESHEIRGHNTFLKKSLISFMVYSSVPEDRKSHNLYRIFVLYTVFL